MSTLSRGYRKKGGKRPMSMKKRGGKRAISMRKRGGENITVSRGGDDKTGLSVLGLVVPDFDDHFVSIGNTTVSIESGE